LITDGGKDGDRNGTGLNDGGNGGNVCFIAHSPCQFSIFHCPFSIGETRLAIPKEECNNCRLFETERATGMIHPTPFIFSPLRIALAVLAVAALLAGCGREERPVTVDLSKRAPLRIPRA
jgi:hypothetical protein